MPFIEYNESTGLIVKSKADVLEDLKSICKTAYGSDFTVVEGTEMYTLLDVLSAAIAEMGSASKAVYDAFGFITATGNPLAVLCSLAGVSRRPNEPDNVLRARYYKQLYTLSTGTQQGLEAKLLEATNVDEGKVKALTNEVKIITNDSSDNTKTLTLVGRTVTLPTHSIWICIRKYDAFFKDNSNNTALTNYIKYDNLQYIQQAYNADNVNYGAYISSDATYTTLQTQLNNIILSYKSLGCGILAESVSPYDNFYIASSLNISLTLTLKYYSAKVNTEQRGAIANKITENLTNYINLLKIGEPIKSNAIYGRCYNAYVELGYEGDEFECTLIALTQGSTSVDATNGMWFFGEDAIYKCVAVNCTWDPIV